MHGKSVTFQSQPHFNDDVGENLRSSGLSSTGLGTMVSLKETASQKRHVQLGRMKSTEDIMKRDTRGVSFLRQDSTLNSRTKIDLSVDEESYDEPKMTLWCCFRGERVEEEEIIQEVDRKKLQMSFTRRAVRKMNGGRRSSVIQRLRGQVGVYGAANVEVNDFSRLQRLVMEMKKSLSQLSTITPPNEKLERWACLIYESMSAASRTFHGVQHVFDLSVNCDEIQKLCAFFHDCIYYTIDGGLSKFQSEYLDAIIIEKDEGIFLTQLVLEETMEMVISIFGFKKGQAINPFKGLNEFLSAALAIRCLTPYLSKRYLAELAACIEATIPFRGEKPMDALYVRLTKANKTFDLEMKDKEIEKAVQRSADFANRDLFNFTLQNRAVFLSNTWNLLPESNISLRHTRVFRISDFTFALVKMTGFFNSLDADTLFHNFRNGPSDELIAEFTEKARENIEIASIYMNCKLLAISVLAAFAELTGGDAPVAMFLGDLPEPHHISPSIEDLIVLGKRHQNVVFNEKVLALLEEGREEENDFDIKNSPCAGFLYAAIGDNGLKKVMKHIVHPMDEKHSKALLLDLPKKCVAEIGMACSHMALTRTNLLRELMHKIQHDGVI